MTTLANACRFAASIFLICIGTSCSPPTDTSPAQPAKGRVALVMPQAKIGDPCNDRKALEALGESGYTGCGPLAPFQIRETIAKDTAALDACGRAIDSNLPLPKLVLTWTITSEGRVVDVTSSDDTNVPAALSRCLIERVQQMVFPQPLGGGFVEVHYPFRFELERAK